MTISPSRTPGNSGVFEHVTGTDQVWPKCLEIQLRSGDAGSVRTNGGAQVREVLPPAANPRQVARQRAGVSRMASGSGTGGRVR